MRFWISGPRIFGVRPGISFRPDALSGAFAARSTFLTLVMLTGCCAFAGAVLGLAAVAILWSVVTLSGTP